jgi:hypothetical protein
MEVNMEKVNILGATYKVRRGVSIHSDPDLSNRFGYCNFIECEIVIADIRTIPIWSNESDSVIKSQENETLRHEVLHAFLSESGLRGSSCDVQGWAMNEEMVDWFALQYPKIKKVYEKLGCEV